MRRSRSKQGTLWAVLNSAPYDTLHSSRCDTTHEWRLRQEHLERIEAAGDGLNAPERWAKTALDRVLLLSIANPVVVSQVQPHKIPHWLSSGPPSKPRWRYRRSHGPFSSLPAAPAAEHSMLSRRGSVAGTPQYPRQNVLDRRRENMEKKDEQDTARQRGTSEHVADERQRLSCTQSIALPQGWTIW